MTEAAGSSRGVKIGWIFSAGVSPLAGPDECRADHWSWSSLWSNCLGGQICCKSAWWSCGGAPELYSISLPACLPAAFLSPLAQYYSLLLTDEEFSLVRRDVPEPGGSFRRRIRASVDSRRLQINKSTGFKNLSFQLLRSPWGGSRRGQQRWRTKWQSWPNCRCDGEFGFWSPCWEKSSCLLWLLFVVQQQRQQLCKHNTFKWDCKPPRTCSISHR